MKKISDSITIDLTIIAERLMNTENNFREGNAYLRKELEAILYGMIPGCTGSLREAINTRRRLKQIEELINQ